MTTWKWTTTDDGHMELHPAEYERGEGDSVLYHGADWPISQEHQDMIAAAPDTLTAARAMLAALEAMHEATQLVIASWSQGDLASAVNALEETANYTAARAIAQAKAAGITTP